MRLTTGQKLALAGATAIKVAIVARWYLRRKARRALPEGPPVAQRRTVCPADVGRTPAATGSLRPGDHVVITLASEGGSRREATWARVKSVGPKTVMVEIEGELEGHAVKPLTSGFTVGDKLMIDRGCIWDVMSASVPSLCGAKGAVVVGRDPYDGEIYQGDIVQVVLDRGTGFVPTWARVVRVSSTGSVLTVVPTDVPAAPVDITRDCVYEIQR